MTITHAAVKSTGDTGSAAEWNANHVVTGVDKPKNFTTIIVAAFDSLDTTRADFICDGVDDQDTINDAIDALPAWGGRISLQEGHYAISGMIEVDVDNTSIEGLGPATRITTNANTRLIYVNTLNNVVIKGLTLVGTGAGAAQNGIFIRISTDCIIREVWFENLGANPIASDNNDGIIIESNWIDGGVVGIRLTTLTTDSLIKNNVIINTAAEGIYMTTGSRVSIVGNNTEGSIQITDANDSIISNNIVHNGGADGIKLFGADNNIVNGNVSIDNAGDGIDINNTSDNNIVIGNQLTGNLGVGLNDLGVGTDAAHNKV